MSEALTNYLERVAGLLNSTPARAVLQGRVTEHPGIAAYLASPNRCPTPREQYVVDVARVLQRALPPHMPDPERFVVRG